jgi:primosomal protein N' (replication factor Y)
MIADVAFDVAVLPPLSYRVPDGWRVAAGQRVWAPLRGGARVGMITALRAGDDPRLKPLTAVAEAGAILSDRQLDFVRWIAAESLTSVGACAAALLPPAVDAAADGPRGASREVESPRPDPSAAASGPRAELLVGAGRERRLLERIGAARGGTLVVVPDLESASRWARRLGRRARVARLDSGAPDAERAGAWRALARGDLRLAVGTRSALLAPLAAPGTLALVDEHDPAHKPPGAPRLHSRDILLARAARERCAVVLVSATPSVETWWRADQGHVEAGNPVSPGPWPVVTLADTRGILRREPLTPALARAVREALSARRRVLLVVSRLASALACDECGEILRCPGCALALAWSRAGRRLDCRLCGRILSPPETCPACRGRRLSPFGWGAERVEHAVRRRFPRATVARWEPDGGGRRDVRAPRGVDAADVVIGTRAALRVFGPGGLGCAGFVAPDQLLRQPDFRAGERLFEVLWAAAERVGADGSLVIQSQNPGHYAIDAVARQDLAAFYRREIPLRAELGYPPFRRLALLTVDAAHAGGVGARALADEVGAALRASPALTVYPAVGDRRGRRARLVVKGGDDLPRVLADALEEFRAPRPRGIIEVEVDPVEWPS